MSGSNPYVPPSTTVQGPAVEVPPEIAKKIRSAWIAACISGAITLLLTLVAMSGTALLGLDAWSLVDVALIFGLAFGISRKSRVCAVLMLGYFVLSKILMMVETGQPSGLLLAVVFGYYFWQGVHGTFAYHRLKAAPPAPVGGGA